jgi:hypothetical protein
MDTENFTTMEKTRRKAESLVINSAGQRPAKGNTRQLQAPEGRNQQKHQS